MEKPLKIGIACMLLAIIIMPVVLPLIRGDKQTVMCIVVLSMLLELLGLVFVAIHLYKKRKLKPKLL